MSQITNIKAWNGSSVLCGSIVVLRTVSFLVWVALILLAWLWVVWTNLGIMKKQRSQSQIQADGMTNGDSSRIGLYEKSPNKPSSAHKSFVEHKRKFPSLKNLFTTKANDGTFIYIYLFWVRDLQYELILIFINLHFKYFWFFVWFVLYLFAFVAVMLLTVDVISFSLFRVQVVHWFTDLRIRSQFWQVIQWWKPYTFYYPWIKM